MIRTVEHYPAHCLGKLIVEADEKLVQIKYRDLTGSYSRKYHYQDLRENTEHFEAGESSWGTVGFGILIFGFVAGNFLYPFYRLKFLLPFFLLGVLCILLRFWKHKWVVFLDKDGDRAFVLRVNKSRQIIEYIKNQQIFCSRE